ncbi:thermonuclease family protein [Nocardioides panacisoli]|uniref:thermonuclease family protein n=1 Tax=Nocardioides panacisoli TaxID=627624 RepID=UPI001C62B747|nr:thermonuclease family protein [Nocardioides panacisoli]QYJ05268.1 thermonuclease family protein [Nocardioides panacisoli]
MILAMHPLAPLARLLVLGLLLGHLAVLGIGTAPHAAAADKDCGDFDTQAQAQRFFLNNNPGADPHRLDADGDRVACETLPCPCNNSTKPSGGTKGTTTQPKAKKTLRQRGRVVRVIDGDTVDVRLGKRVKRVRMIGINTPERGRCGYGTATRKLTRFLPKGQRVLLVSDPTQDYKDRYGRLLRYVKKGNSDANRRQVKSGMSRVYVYRKPFKKVSSFRSAQRMAKNHNRGLWRQCW